MPKNIRERLRAVLALCAIAVMLTAGGVPDAFATSVDDVQVASAPLSTKASAMNGMVRVYLSSLGNPSRLDLTVVGNYSISTTGEFISSGSSLTVGFSSSTGAITLTHNGVKTNMGTSFSLRRHSASGTNGIKISQARESNNPYPGDLTFKAVSSGSGYTLYTIANIYIENYLYGVLPYEMGNSTNIEALKAQAVAARTYTVRMMQNRASGLYDVNDTTSDQVYRGTPLGNANCVAAVDATKGIVLMYGSSYITTYYSASNGGQTEIDRSGTAYAYMKVKDDPFDYANPSSTVKKKTVYADLTSSMNPSGLISLLKTKAVTKLQNMGYSATQGNTTLQTLSAMGVELILNHFGSGISSVTGVLDLSVNTLKLDRMLLWQLETNPKAATVIAGLVRMVRELGLNIMAEGVETSGQLKILNAAGCTFQQGFYYSPAVSEESMTRILASDRARAQQIIEQEKLQLKR